MKAEQPDGAAVTMARPAPLDLPTALALLEETAAEAQFWKKRAISHGFRLARLEAAANAAGDTAADQPGDMQAGKADAQSKGKGR